MYGPVGTPGQSPYLKYRLSEGVNSLFTHLLLLLASFWLVPSGNYHSNMCGHLAFKSSSNLTQILPSMQISYFNIATCFFHHTLLIPLSCLISYLSPNPQLNTFCLLAYSKIYFFITFTGIWPSSSLECKLGDYNWDGDFSLF